MHLVRQHILEILKERSGATVAELAACLNMAPVSVRHHLDILQGDNLIRVDRLARNGSVGRPQQVYALTPEASSYFPDNFAALAAGLLRQLKYVLPPDQLQAALKVMAQEFAAPLQTENAEAPLTDQRMAQIVDFLNERGYLARWEWADEEVSGEAHARVYLLHKCNCPYANLPTEYDELCIMDQALVDQLVGQPSERIRSLAHDGPCCTYRIVRSATNHKLTSHLDSTAVA